MSKKEKAWKDPETGIFGYGNVYGDHSFNNRPVTGIEVNMKELSKSPIPFSSIEEAIKRAKRRV